MDDCLLLLLKESLIIDHCKWSLNKSGYILFACLDVLISNERIEHSA